MPSVSATATAPRTKTIKTKAPVYDYRRAADWLKQVSDPTRLSVLQLLRNGDICVGDLCQKLGNMSQPAVSHHLALLRHGHLIEPRRAGKQNFYSLTETGRMLVEAVDRLGS